MSARVWNYAQALRATGERVFLLSYGDFCQGDKLIEVDPGIWGYKGDGRTDGNVKHFFTAMSALVKDGVISGVLFYPTPNPSFELRFMRWRRRMRFTNVVCEVNEVRRFEQTYVKSFSLPKRLLYKIITANSEKLTRRYRGLVCISENIRQYFSRYNSLSVVVPILSDMPDMMPISECAPAPGGFLRFVFTGTIAIEKENLVELLRGFYVFNKSFSSWELLLYGRVPEENQHRLESILEILVLSDKVRFMGEAEHARIPAILSEADCLILPRRNTPQNYYGFSTKLSEYAVSGTPVILTDTGVVFHYFKDGRDCLKVNGYEAAGFCEQLLRFVNLTVAERDEIASNAFKTAKESFDWRLYSSTLSGFIKQ